MRVTSPHPTHEADRGGHFFLGSIPRDGSPIFLNDAILTQCTIEAKNLRLTLAELGHEQPPTPIHVDNTTAVGIVNSTIKRQRSRAMNMRYFWLLCHEAQQILNVSYHPGHKNLGDYQTKLHNGAHHQQVGPFYLHTKQSPKWLQRAQHPSVRKGCVGRTEDPYMCRTPLPEIPSGLRTS